MFKTTKEAFNKEKKKEKETNWKNKTITSVYKTWMLSCIKRETGQSFEVWLNAYCTYITIKACIQNN